MIVYHRTHRTVAAVLFFVIGACFPLVGIILALFVKPAGGWYPDPWQQASYTGTTGSSGHRTPARRRPSTTEGIHSEQAALTQWG
jgi:hypothetical protein